MLLLGNKRQNLICNSTPISFLTFLTLSHMFVSFNTVSFLSTPALSSTPTRSFPSFLKVQLHSDLQMKRISKSLLKWPQYPHCNSQWSDVNSPFKVICHFGYVQVGFFYVLFLTQGIHCFSTGSPRWMWELSEATGNRAPLHVTGGR